MDQGALIVALVLLLPAVWVARKATLRRLAWRNVTSRPAEALLVTAGTMLGTAIIVASFAVGDTIEGGIGGVVDTSLGPIDESVTIEDPSQISDLESAIIDARLEAVDGVVAVLSLPTAVTTTGADAVGEPNVWLAEIDFDKARAFGENPLTSGFSEAGETPSGDEVVIISRLARQLDVGAGELIEIHAYGSSHVFTVRQVIDRSSAAGFNSVYVPLGSFDSFVAQGSVDGSPPRAEVLISNDGDWFTGADLTQKVVAELETTTAGIEGVDVESRKADLLEEAAADGTEFTTLFNGIGSFAVIAGVLLIVNLFVMLSEERKTSLGVMRAIGFTRSEVAKSFAIEGAVYAVAATVAGVVAGVGVGWVLVQVLKSIFFDQNDFLTLNYSLQPESLMLAGAIGLGITMFTIWATAYRISQFNVIAAVRDLPQPPTKRGKIKVFVFSTLGVAAGAGIGYLGISQEIQSAAMAGVPLMAFSVIPLIRPLVGERFAGLVGGVVAMVWGVFAFNILPDVMRESEIDVFVVQGVVLVAGAVTVSASASVLWTRTINILSRAGAGLSTRLGLVYPLARKGRTGLLLGMFSLVVFMITFLSVFSQIFTEQTRALADDSRAGYDIVATSAVFNPVSSEDVMSVEGVNAVAPLVTSPAEFVVDGETDPLFWKVTGFGESLLANGIPVLGDRLDAYTSDEDVFRAVLADSDLLIVDDFFLDNAGGPGGKRYVSGDQVRMLTSGGETLTMTVVGVLASDFVFAGSYASAEMVEEFLDPVPGTFYVGVAAEADGDLVARQLNAELISFGVDAETFESSVATEVAETAGIVQLFQGFLSLGLLVGIAGLAVVLIRAVHERRRAIGVLRALGIQAKAVRRSFMIEAGFVAIQGVVIGASLGLVTAYQVIVNSETLGTGTLAFSWPWFGLAIVVIVPTAAALLAAAAPAKRAATITPAVALRTE